MQFREIDCFEDILQMVSMMKLMIDNGNKEIFKSFQKCELDYDYFYEYVVDVLNMTVSDFEVDINDDFECQEYILADSSITEFYELCQKYCKKANELFGECIFITDADEYVYEEMRGIGGHGYDYELISQETEKRLVSIVFYQYYDFERYLYLVKAVMNIVDYYREKAKMVKSELKKLKSINNIKNI